MAHTTQGDTLFTFIHLSWRIQLCNSQMKEMHRAKYGGAGTEFPCSLPTCHTHRPFHSTLMCSPTQKLSKSHCSRVFLEVSSLSHGWLSHLPLVINSASSPSLLLYWLYNKSQKNVHAAKVTCRPTVYISCSGVHKNSTELARDLFTNFREREL